MAKTHGPYSTAGKTRRQTPKVESQVKPRKCVGRAKLRSKVNQNDEE